MNWNTIINLGSLLVAFISAFSAISNNKRDNKTIKDIEESKEKLYLENQKINREQKLNDKKNTSIVEFLKSASIFIDKKTEENKAKTIESCSQLLSDVYKNKEEGDLIKGLIKNIQKYDLNSKNKMDEANINQLIRKTITQLLNIEKSISNKI